jgi:hypothetical protein
MEGIQMESKKQMTLEERINDFQYCVACDLHEEDRQMVLDFSAYWTECGPKSKKFRAELEKVFNVKRRFATWKRNNEKWNVNNKPKFIEKVIDKQNNLEELFNLIDKKHGTN